MACSQAHKQCAWGLMASAVTWDIGRQFISRNQRQYEQQSKHPGPLASTPTTTMLPNCIGMLKLLPLATVLWPEF